jgi:surface carbohydrate biosynthesis protein
LESKIINFLLGRSKVLDFLILYEHKVRELENICLLKVELENRGYEVEIYNINDQIKLKHFISKPKVVITPWLYSDREVKLILSKFGSDIKIVNLQWEQVLSEKWEKNGFHNPRGIAQNTYHLCWGKANRDRLINSGVEPKNAIIAGPLHMDFFHPSFKTYYYSKDDIARKYKLDGEKKWVLYISSFTLVNMSNSNLNSIEKRFNTSIRDYQSVMKVSKEKTLKWIEGLLSKNKDIVYIYRPHPNEREDKTLLKMEKDYPNFRLISDLSVKQWITVCEFIDTWFSTSVAEIFYSGKKCNIIRPVELPGELEPVIYKNARHITSFEDFLNSYNHNITRVFPLDTDLVRYHYSVTDQNPAYISISNQLENIINSPVKMDLGNASLKWRAEFFALKYIVKALKFFKVTNIKFLANKDNKLIRLLFGKNIEKLDTDEMKLLEKKIRDILRNQPEKI